MNRLHLIVAVFCLHCLSITSDAADAAMDRVEAANAQFAKGEIREAVAVYRALLGEKPPPPIWGKVTFNLGIAHMALSEYDKAIQTFESIFPSQVDDREAGGHLMEEFRNYRYRACLKISACYEAKGDIPRALSFAISAREKYKYEAHCGTCEKNARQTLDARIKTLEKKK